MSRLIFVITLSLYCAAVGFAQNHVDIWLRDRIEAKITVEANSNRAIRQKEAPAGEIRSTSLVDQSSAGEFVNVALALAPVATGANARAAGNGSGSGVVTASFYSLLALLNKRDLTDPEFYKAHTSARQLSFSLGSTASDITKDNTDNAGTTFGFKFTFFNDREIYSKRNGQLLANLQSKLSTVSAIETRVKAKILIKLFCAHNQAAIDGVTDLQRSEFCAAPDQPSPPAALAAAFANFISSINTEAGFTNAINTLPALSLKEIDGLIDRNLDLFGTLRERIDSTYDAIKNGRQLAIVATYVNRPDLGTDDFRGTLAFDYGLSPSLNWTVNGSFDHRDRKAGFDTRGGRFATEFLGRLTGYGSDLWGRQPITLAFAGEGKWLTKQKPQYSVQAKLTIPIAAGLDWPIVYRWSKRIDLVDKEGKELKMGLTVDLSNLSQLLKGK